MDLEVLIGLMGNARAILSHDWDWLMTALMVSKASVITTRTTGVFDLYRNAEFIGVENDIFVGESGSIVPMDVFRYCCESS
jgi:hypothetical protein